MSFLHNMGPQHISSFPLPPSVFSYPDQPYPALPVLHSLYFLKLRSVLLLLSRLPRPTSSQQYRHLQKEVLAPRVSAGLLVWGGTNPKTLKVLTCHLYVSFEALTRKGGDETVTHRSQWLNIKKQVNPDPGKNFPIVRSRNSTALGLGT